MLILMRWSVGPAIWEPTLNGVIMLLAGPGGVLLIITATIGGQLAGSATFLSDLLRRIAWEVYATLCLPNRVPLMLAALIVLMAVVALPGRRSA